MLKNLVEFSVDSSSPDFCEVQNLPVKHDVSFRIGANLLVNFDNSKGGGVEVAAVNPIVGSPYYTIKPINLGGANWFSLEFDINESKLRKLSQIIPYLDVASPESLSLHATLRLHYEDGRSEDVSSTQIEIKRNRVRQNFPIALADLQSAITSPLKRGTCIIFIEAREADLMLYGFGITGVDKEEVRFSDAEVRDLRIAAAQRKGQVEHRYAITTGDNRVKSNRHLRHELIADGVFIDFEPAENRAIDIKSKKHSITMDFEGMSSARWRNFEFRFEEVKNNSNLQAVIRIVGSTQLSGDKSNRNAILTVREYDQHYKWTDTVLDTPLRLSSRHGEQVAAIDLYPILTDSRILHSFGLMVFLPEDTVRVDLTEMEAFVYDKTLSVE